MTATLIALFNHKGGVSKTTTTFHLGWVLAELGKKVLLVDTDPQCNLSGLILGLKGEEEFDKFYTAQTNNNLKSGLKAAFDALPERLMPVECVEVPGCKNLLLLAGHIGISEYEVGLSVAQELSGSIQTLQNLPGSIHYLVSKTAEKYDVDYVLFDMNPGLSSINQNVLMVSDYFIVPSSPDFFSMMALESLKRILPRWQAWAERAASNPVLQAATYPFPERRPKFLGNIIQKYRLRMGGATVGFQSWIDKIGQITKTEFVPELRKHGMALSDEEYKKGGVSPDNYALANIPDFNTLIARSQEAKTPVFAMTPAQLGSAGVVLEQDQAKQDEFRAMFAGIANAIQAMIDAKN